MPQKKKNNLVTVLLAIFLLFVILGALYYFWGYRSGDDVDTEVLPTIIFKKVDAETIKGLGELRACGNWPILTISPDKDRGNPFNIKNTEIGPVFGTVTPECLPVKFK
jgi:hypothetical protein